MRTPPRVAAPKSAEAPHAYRRLRPLASITEATVNPSGILWRKTARKMIHPSQFETRKPDSDGDAVEEGVNDQSDQDGIAFVGMNEFVLVCFFAEVEVGRDGVLEEMNDQVAEQDQEGCVTSAEFEARGYNLDQRRGQHESSTQGNEVSEVAPLPVSLDDDGAAENVGAGGGEAEQDAREDRVHFAADDSRGGRAVLSFSSQLSALSSQLSALSSQLSALSSQLSAADAAYGVSVGFCTCWITRLLLLRRLSRSVS